MKRFFSNSFGRILIILLAVLVQLAFHLAVIRWLRDKYEWIETILHVLGAFITLGILKNSRHLSSDILWILLINALPIAGTILYLFLGANLFVSSTYKKIKESESDSRRYYRQDERIMQTLKKEAPENYGQFEYISRFAGYPVYKNTGFDYYSWGQEGYEVMLEELRKAQKFIFLEYFIIEKGTMWNQILEILEDKVKHGVEVRVIYDDLGSFFVLPSDYADQLEAKGIRCIPFNRISPILNIIINHRDHRKIMVIDGKVAFSGGINLADEYINVREKYGKWKDNIIRITGEAVWSYTVMFLTHWNALRKTERTFLSYRNQPKRGKNDGFIAPYGETPLDNEICAQNIYMNILNEADSYCYICTPYLIIDTELINALILTAKKGVDVRIVTPGIPDKKIVFQVTRSFYSQLMEGGVKIYEYDPGFVHAKVMVSDDCSATVGTVNFDYRSLYLHFENGTYLYRSEKIAEIRDDLLSMMEDGHEVTPEECRHGLLRELFWAVLRTVAPLM